MAGVLAILARPTWEILVAVFEDPLADHGAAYISLVSDRPEDVWIMAYDLGRYQRSLTGETDGRGYRIGREEETRIFRFAVDIVAHNSCDVVVTFRQQGPRASACTNHMPAYGGVWLD